ncbi:MAG: hypothetical protein AAF641_15955 [Pseudomonadota bacterium]
MTGDTGLTATFTIDGTDKTQKITIDLDNDQNTHLKNLLTGKAERYDQLLLEEYNQLHQSIGQIHARMDAMSRGFLLTIGAVFSLFYGADGAITHHILWVAPFLAIAARFLMGGMWKAAGKLCNEQTLIEESFTPDAEQPTPARNALITTYQDYDKPFHSAQKKNRLRPDKRLTFWTGIIIFTVLFASGPLWASYVSHLFDIESVYFLPEEEDLADYLRGSGAHILPNGAEGDAVKQLLDQNDDADCTLQDGLTITCN